MVTRLEGPDRALNMTKVVGELLLAKRQGHEEK
jgi:hypothetical protein